MEGMGLGVGVGEAVVADPATGDLPSVGGDAALGVGSDAR